MSIYTIKNTRQKTVRQYKYIQPAFSYYQTEESELSQFVYWEDTSATATYPITAVSTGTVSLMNTNYPLVANRYNTVWDVTDTVASSTVPMTTRPAPYSRIVGTSTSTGAKIAVKWDISSDRNVGGRVCIVTKSSATSQTYKLRVRTSVGNFEEFSGTTNATANIWDLQTFVLGTGTATGTVDYANITELEVCLNGTVDVALIYVVNNTLCQIGKVITLQFNAIAEFKLQAMLETAELKVYNLTDSYTPTGIKGDIELKTADKNLKVKSAVYGRTPKQTTEYVPQILTSPNDGSKLTIASGTMTSQAGLNILSVTTPLKAGDTLDSAFLASDVSGDTNSYHYNSSTGLWTFDTSYNGVQPTVTILVKRSVLSSEIRGLKTGAVGRLFVVRNTDGNTETLSPRKVQLLSYEESPSAENDSVTIKAAILPDSNELMAKTLNY